ncbi:hypothetical protein Srot_2192 [Segniliparus rotundus DSM 44985]|uniref:PknH-like extracellular domain-containing protein n=1 Tax=Segniliparus rotundus (strain ATCC BAA-972 / CDC 1076 / CIP 108378 / DSM 44985 / JCM 13578) TaxID=640132 RepID=D6Z9X4_SEGRD|nr:hypothetical protein [Segniliparus rotundus]ADG98644.1 hypothetical protein Srot_2192 [Segniliparus rotundus DSM 44985]
MRARMPQGFAAGLALAAAMLATVPPAAAAQGDLASDTNLDQFYPGQDDGPDGWSLAESDHTAPPSARSTTPPGCSFQTLFPAEGSRRAVLPSGSVLSVQLLRAQKDGAQRDVRTVQSWAERCASFTALGGGGTTGKNWLRVEPADAPSAKAVSYLVSAQSPFVPDELELAGTVRGALILVSQTDPGDDDSAADVYRAIAAKINDWRG